MLLLLPYSSTATATPPLLQTQPLDRSPAADRPGGERTARGVSDADIYTASDPLWPYKLFVTNYTRSTSHREPARAATATANMSQSHSSAYMLVARTVRLRHISGSSHSSS